MQWLRRDVLFKMKRFVTVFVLAQLTNLLIASLNNVSQITWCRNNSFIIQFLGKSSSDTERPSKYIEFPLL